MKVIQILHRIYTHNLEDIISFYENLLQEKCQLRIKYAGVNLELAQVGDILILAGAEESLKPFRATIATFLVDSILEYRDHLIKYGAEIIRDIKTVPTGLNMTVRHPDGTVVEYVEHKK